MFNFITKILFYRHSFFIMSTVICFPYQHILLSQQSPEGTPSGSVGILLFPYVGLGLGMGHLMLGL